MRHTLPFDKINLDNIAQVGGKNASLGEMITKLLPLGVKVPMGFATTAESYQQFLKENHIDEKIYSYLDDLDITDIKQLQKTSQAIQQLIIKAEFNNGFINEISQAYQALKLSPTQTVAVRSSATAEDLPEASFAGQQETYLNIHGADNALIAIKKVFASLFTERAIAYRVHNNFAHRQVAISAGIQQMIRSDIASSGVMFTVDTESGFDQVVFITAAYGLGETVVQGQVNTDEFYVHKPMLKNNKNAVISKTLGSKKIKMIYRSNTGSQDNKADKPFNPVETIETSEGEQAQFCITQTEILELARYGVIIEEHYGKPMDIEWAKDGETNELYIIQARPETVTRKEQQQQQDQIEQYHIDHNNTQALISGRSVGHKVGYGIARIIHNTDEMHLLKPGEILIADITDPDWEPVMKKAAAIITNRGGRTCHAAIIAREMGVPAIVGCGNATEIINNGNEITVSCAEGEAGYVYPGKIAYSIEQIKLEYLPDNLPLKLSMNLANPEQAFNYQFLPNHGIGLARLEFIINRMIGIHPNALLNLDKLPSELQTTIKHKIAAYDSPTEYYIERMAEGIATIGAAFYPKPVIVRFSDFKSNEYANLLGGDIFEPKEENPMIGYRGASRYISDDFRACFALECEAIKRVRLERGLDNVHVMFPFVRTLDTAKKLISLTKDYGLERGKDGLKIYMMCEIPANIILAEEFLAYFDGLSIGSNDLTQLTLGVDRDSALVAEEFDERDPAVKKMLEQAIKHCKKQHKYVGICGQAPSDYPELADWLAEQGISALSLSPDTIVKTWLRLSKKQ